MKYIMSNSDHYNLWKIHKTINEMLNDRCFDDIDEKSLDMDMITWIDKYKKGGIIDRKNLTLIVGNKKRLIHVYFTKEDIGVIFIENIIRELEKEKGINAIIVLYEPINKISEKIIKLINNSKFNIELFNEKELLFNVTKHELVPKHSVISETQKIKLLKTYRINQSQLPRILVTDPVIRYYGLKKGQVVKITRESETAGYYLNYRLIS